MKPKKPKAVRSKVNPAMEFLKQSKSRSGVTTLAKPNSYQSEPSAKAGVALQQLFLQAQGIEWRSRYEAALSDTKPVEGGDAAALEAYARLVCDHVQKLNSLTKDQNLLGMLLPYSKTCFAWPVRISKRKVFGEDAVELIRRLKVGKDTIAGDPSARFNPKSKFGKMAWKMIERIEQCRATPQPFLYFINAHYSWTTAAKALPPFKVKTSPEDKIKWRAVVQNVLKDDLCDPEMASDYRLLVAVGTHKPYWEARLRHKILDQFESIWGLHRKAVIGAFPKFKRQFGKP